MSEYKNILISRTDKIGDVILTLPMITECKKLVPDSKITFLISNKLDDLILGYDCIDELYFIEDLGSNLTDFLKSKNFDTGINVFPRKEIALAMYRAGIKTRVGSAYRFYSMLYNVRIKEHRKYAQKHESDYNLNLLKFLNKPISYEKKFYFRYTANEFGNIKDKLHYFDFNNKYIIIHPGSKGSSLDLPIDKFFNLVEYIISVFPKYKIVLSGSIDDKPVIRLFLEKFPNNNITEIAGKLSLKELMIFIDNSDLFISNSTGPIHIAGALNKKIIGFYPNSAPMNATRWKPLSKSTVILSPEKGDDMNTISHEKINSTIHGFLIN